MNTFVVNVQICVVTQSCVSLFNIVCDINSFFKRKKDTVWVKTHSFNISQICPKLTSKLLDTFTITFETIIARVQKQSISIPENGLLLKFYLYV